MRCRRHARARRNALPKPYGSDLADRGNRIHERGIALKLRLLAVALVAVLTACAGPVPKLEASTAKLGGVKSVAVVRPPEPKAYTVMNFGHPGVAFGLIGGLVAAADQNSKQNQLTAA